MADQLDALKGLKLLLGRGGTITNAAQFPKDKLDGFKHPARRFAFPHFTVTTLADPFDEPVAGNGLLVSLPSQTRTDDRCVLVLRSRVSPNSFPGSRMVMHHP